MRNIIENLTRQHRVGLSLPLVVMLSFWSVSTAFGQMLLPSQSKALIARHSQNSEHQHSNSPEDDGLLVNILVNTPRLNRPIQHDPFLHRTFEVGADHTNYNLWNSRWTRPGFVPAPYAGMPHTSVSQGQMDQLDSNNLDSNNLIPLASQTVRPAPTPISSKSSQFSPNAQEERIAVLMTQDPDQKRSSLSYNPILARVARERAADMARRGYFSHVNPDGLGPNFLAAQAGYALPAPYSKAKDGKSQGWKQHRIAWGRLRDSRSRLARVEEIASPSHSCLRYGFILCGAKRVWNRVCVCGG